MFEYIKNYLREKIGTWYMNAQIDYGIDGCFIDCQKIGTTLKIIWEEESEKCETLIPWFADYSPAQLYDIWMEG